MKGVVALLNEVHREQVQAAADELRRFGWEPATVGMPHLTLHAAPSYDMEKIARAVKSLGRSLPAFEAATTGIGLFRGETRYLYLPVIRSPRLTVVQRAVIEEVARHSEGSEPYWDPDRWMPHITLATASSDQPAGPAVDYLLTCDLNFTFPIDALSLVEGEPDAHVVLSAPLET